MRTILFCSLVWAGCFDYERLSSGLAADGATADADQGSEQDGGVQPDGATEVDLAGADLTQPADMAQPVDLTPPPADMSCTQYTHSNGLGATWTDCVPLGTYNATQAMKACTASYPAANCIYPSAGATCSGKGVAYNGNWTYFVYAGTYISKTIAAGGDCTVGGTLTGWN